MTSGPRITITDDYTFGMTCAICGEDSLSVSHVDDLPDFVECASCESAFLVEEGGERVFYGKIAPGYPETESFALQQWVWIDAVDIRARQERPEADEEIVEQIDVASRLSFEVAPEEDDTFSGLAEQPGVPLAGLSFLIDEAEDEVEAFEEIFDEEPQDSENMLERLAVQAPEAAPSPEPVPDWAADLQAAPAAEPEPEGVKEKGKGKGKEKEKAKEKAEPEVFIPHETDPPPGQRYRVVTRGSQVVFPGDTCAHCMRTPVKGRLAVLGTLPKGQELAERRQTTFNIPLCGECRKRASALSEDAKNARLQGYLMSAILALVFVIAVLAIGIVNVGMGIPGFVILGIVFIIGFTAPAMFLLGRVGKFPPPPDAAYVRSTLLVPRETQGLETAFEWRNPDYAEKFHGANEANVLGNLIAVKDRAAPPDRST
jgi:hypothetical protein